jgi:hypothetical protein
LETYLRRQAERGNGSLLIIDEAQNFEQPLLEEVRLLSNIAKPGGPPLLQIALVGQPELERKLSLPELRQLKQRIGVHYRIEPLNREETLQYVHHRAGVAGGYPKVLFSEETVAVLFEKTYGLPREINQVASQALLAAYVEDSTRVRPEHILGAIREMSFRSVLEGTKPSATPAEPPVRPAVVEVRPMPGRVDPLTRESGPAAPRLMDPPIRPAEPAPIRPADPAPMRPAEPAPIRAQAPAEARRPELARPERARIAPAPAAPVPSRRSADRPATAPSFGSIPPLTARRVDTPPSEARTNLTRIGVIVGAVAILGVAAFLWLAPQKPMPDELHELESEKTMPVAPRVGVNTPVGTVPTQTQSADAAGTISNDPAATSGGGPATSGPANPAGSAGVTPPTAAMPAPAAPTTPDTATARPPAGPPATVVNGYRLQVSSLRDSLTAVRVGNDLARRSGLPLEIVSDRKATGDLWYAVYLGSFATSEEAAAGREQFAATIREFSGALIRQPRRR